MLNLLKSSAVIGVFLAFPSLAASAKPAITEPVTFDKIETFLKANPKVRTIPRFLQALPASFRAHYTLLHSSPSSQAASPENPRAIVYGEKATTVIAFNGDKSQRGFLKIELIQWRQKTRSFEFREIEFPESRQNGRVKISDANPPLCLTCHRKDPRPNWEPYSDWPDAYAGHDDRLEEDGEKLNESLKDFVADAEEHPRYSQLPDLEENYFTGEKPDPHNRNQRTPVKHNIMLSAHFNQLNYQRIARLAENSPDFKKYRYAVMGVLASCEKPLERYFPESQSLPKLFNEPFAYSNRAEALLSIFESRGVAVKDWGTSFGAKPRDFTSPDVWAAELLHHILDHQSDLVSHFWQFEGYFYAHPHAQALKDNAEKTCDAMIELSQAAFAPPKP